MYQLNDKIKDLKPYDPVTEDSRIHLDANESFLPLPAPILEELAAAVPQVAFNRYPDPAAQELCQAFAQYYGVPVENVAAGNGSDELITVLFTGFLQKGEAFATLEPDFSMYAFNGYLQEARHVPIPKGEDYAIDVDSTVETCQREGVKLLIFSNPGNPTSLVCPREEVRRLICGLPDTLVVLDEAYMDFSDQSLLPEFQQYDNLLILRTCSKAFGMAGLRLGYGICSDPELLLRMEMRLQPWNVSIPAQEAGIAALREGEFVDRARRLVFEESAFLKAELEKLGYHVFASQANYLFFKGEDWLGEALLEEKIMIRDCSNYPGLSGGFWRIAVKTHEENQRLLEAVGKVREAWQKR